MRSSLSGGSGCGSGCAAWFCRSRRAWRSHSRAPFDPVTGDGMVPATRHGARSTPATARSSARRSDGSSSGGASSPSSNIGFTSATRSASGANVSVSICGTASATERYERSIVTTPIGAHRGIADRSPRFVRSRFTTRLWFRRSPRSCPWPASTANTLRAPCSKQHAGEAARRGAEVDALPVRDVDREPVERGPELVLAAERPRRLDHDRRVRADLRTGVRDHASVDQDVSGDERALGIGEVRTRPGEVVEHVAELGARRGAHGPLPVASESTSGLSPTASHPCLDAGDGGSAVHGLGERPVAGLHARVVRAEPAAHGRELVGAFRWRRGGERFGTVAARPAAPSSKRIGDPLAVEHRERAGAHEPRVGRPRARASASARSRSRTSPASSYRSCSARWAMRRSSAPRSPPGEVREETSLRTSSP